MAEGERKGQGVTGVTRPQHYTCLKLAAISVRCAKGQNQEARMVGTEERVGAGMVYNWQLARMRMQVGKGVQKCKCGTTSP